MFKCMLGMNVCMCVYTVYRIGPFAENRNCIDLVQGTQVPLNINVKSKQQTVVYEKLYETPLLYASVLSKVNENEEEENTTKSSYQTTKTTTPKVPNKIDFYRFEFFSSELYLSLDKNFDHFSKSKEITKSMLSD